jgi:hypothetical protein
MSTEGSFQGTREICFLPPYQKKKKKKKALTKYFEINLGGYPPECTNDQGGKRLSRIKRRGLRQDALQWGEGTCRVHL